MEELIFLFVFILIYLYSFVYRNIAILMAVIVGFGALYLKVEPIFVWGVVFVLSILRFNKHGIKDEL